MEQRSESSCFVQGWAKHFTLTLPPVHPVNCKGLHAMPFHIRTTSIILALRKPGVNCQRFCVTMIALAYLFLNFNLSKREDNC